MGAVMQMPGSQGGVSWQDLLSADWSGIDPADIDRFAEWDPELSETIRLAASSSLIGQGREVAEAGHALKLLGAARVRHIALWHRMREFFAVGGDGAAECVTIAAAAYVVAKAQGIPPYGAITAGFAARLGQRLLVPDPEDQAVLGALLEQVHPARRERLEERLFGTTALQRLEDATSGWPLPRDLAELLNPPRRSAARRVIDGCLALLANEEPRDQFGEMPEVAKERAGVLRVEGVPWRKPAVPEPEDVLLLMADVKDDAEEARKTIEEKDRHIGLFRDLLDLRDKDFVEDILRPTQMALSLDAEVSRALRYKRRFSAVAVRLDPRRPVPEGQRGQDLLAEMARMLRRATRSADHVGFLDGRTLLVMLPESDLGGARLFGDRAWRGLSAARQSGQPKPLVYLTSLAQEAVPGAEGLIRSLMAGLAAMEQDPQKVRFRWNEVRLQRVKAVR